jgi:molecular chaperone DnaK
MSTIGIDFGTTNSVAAINRGTRTEVLQLDSPPLQWEPYGFGRVMPSTFSIESDSQLTFGWAAKTSLGSKFDAVKRLFATQQDLAFAGDGESLEVEEAATLLFSEIRRRAEAQGVAANRAVITVPANSKGRARHRTKICAGMGGFEVLGLVNEPTAAAMTFAQRHPEGRNYLVFDWGGGTLDVTILQASHGVFIERASAGLARSGGLDFDSRLARAIAESAPGATAWSAQQRATFRLEVELAKVRLSLSEVTTVQLPDGSPFRLTRSRFEEVVQPLILESQSPLERCFRDLGVGPGAIDALVLVGGTCKIPAVRSFVRDLVGAEPDPDIDPMTAVAEGAAIAAAILTGDNTDNDFFVSTEHALGTMALSDSGQLGFSVLIPRNHKLPARATQTYVPESQDQIAVRIEVVEGDPESTDLDLVALKDWVVPLLPDASGDRAFELTYEYDVSGILHVEAMDQATGTTLLRDDVSYGIAEDRRRLLELAKRAQESVSSGLVHHRSEPAGELDQETERLLQTAEMKVIPFLSADEASPVIEQVQALRRASGGHVEDAKERLRTSLAPYNFLF